MFIDKLKTAWQQNESLVCVGLDPDKEKIPKHIAAEGQYYEFCKAIVDATAGACCAFKPQFAHFAAAGRESELADLIGYIRTNYPRHVVILDAKRGDIGNTSKMYAKTFFENLNVDAVTVAPYMGSDSVTPFLEFDDKWAIVLALTSNIGSLDFQNTKNEDGKQLFEKVLETSQTWGTDKNMMYVVGATRSHQLSKIREIIPNHFLLVPGVGAQGGSLEEVAKYGMNDECGLLVNSSRGIIYASTEIDFAEKARQEAQKLQFKMDILLSKKGI